ncbi:zinc finger protein 366-like isoform X2 [Polyodon spathula]|uniref:zinc finger protein 366-like isoform X2 n=1 Tax=Polyodon spathula TaxID=7913 RepID=UPI001B7E9995|nr:zinc finger protein 366-like isoform X2 [Polyodon spathula]
MEMDATQIQAEASHLTDGRKTPPINYHQPFPLLKPSRFPHLGDTFSRSFLDYRPEHLMGFERFHVTSEGSRKRKRTPFKVTQALRDVESSDEMGEESSSRKTMDMPHLPYPVPHPPPPPQPMYNPQMIDLSRFHFYRALDHFDTRPVKQEPIQHDVMWSSSPLMMYPSPSYFSKIHPGMIPFPFLMPNPAMHFPHRFYPNETLVNYRADENEKGQDSGERVDVNIHIDDSYYVDMGGGQKRWKCRMCEKSYTSKYNLITHILGHSGIKPHSCNQCGKLFKQLSHLHTHMLTHQGTRPHKCQVCHKAFTQTSHLKRHMMQHSDVKPYTCRICGRGFAYPSELKAHEVKHEGGQDNICVECGLDFPTLTQLKRHLNAHRGPAQYTCTECDKTFQYPSQLQNHMMKHKDIRPYICTECGMEFVQPHHLKQHTLIHKGVKEHKCGICGREFTLLANMKRHVLIHTNIRAYQCHLCFKSFVQKQTLKAHMIVHSDVKPYRCKLCGKEFNRMHNLMGHMHLHSDSKPFKCLYCASKFTLKGNLTRHMKVKHGVMGGGLTSQGFRRRGRFRLPSQTDVGASFEQQEPFDLSQKGRPKLRVSHSDGESAKGSSCQEEEEDSYRMGQYSLEDYHHGNRTFLPQNLAYKQKGLTEAFTEAQGAKEDGDVMKEQVGKEEEEEEEEEEEKQKYYVMKEKYPRIQYFPNQLSDSSGQFYTQNFRRNRRYSIQSRAMIEN